MRILIIAIGLLVFFNFTHAAEKPKEKKDSRTTGLSASIQSSQLDISIPIWTSKNFAIVPSFSFVSVEGTRDEQGVGIGFRSYSSTNKATRPYWGARVAIIKTTPDTSFPPFLNVASSSGETDFIFGPFFGGEYFFSNNFSMGVEAQLNFTKSGANSRRFSNPGRTNINTASSLTATVYF